jgi:prophage regulatory protein
MVNDVEAPPVATGAGTRLLTVEEVATRLSLSTGMVYKMIRAGTFPRPVLVGTRSRWSEREVDDWITARMKQREASRAPARQTPRRGRPPLRAG